MRNPSPPYLPRFLLFLVGATILLSGYKYMVDLANRNSPSAIAYPIHAVR
jgi:hypothetical protein